MQSASPGVECREGNEGERMVELLVVDDESHIRDGIRSGIPWESHGVAPCKTAANAAEALAILEESLPDIVILDIRMPDMDGLELLEIIRKTSPGVHAILISGHDDFEYAQRAITLGAFAYLLKPLDHEKLRDTVLEAKASIERQQALVRKDEELRRAFRQSLPVLRDSFFMELAEGRLPDEEEVRQRAHSLSIGLDGSHALAIAILAEKPPRAEAAAVEEEGFLRFALRSRAEKLLRGVSASSHCFASGEMVGAVVCGSPSLRAAILSSCADLKSWANSSLGHALAVGIGRMHRGTAGVAASWQEACEALQYRIIMGRNEVIDAERLGDRDRPATAFGSFERMLKRCDPEAVAALTARDTAAIDRLAAAISREFVASAAADIRRSRRLVFFLAFFLTRLAFALDCDERIAEGEGDLQAELARPRSQRELEAFLHDNFRRLLDCRAEKDRQRNGHLVRKAKETVDGGVFEDISLSAVAQGLCVHPSYLSRVFRQETRESFHEYATRARMAEAKRLLKATTLRVHEIAERLRYRDLNHFAKVFRKAVGVSPSEFRERG
jgi:two-component system response regulator YesN